LAAARLPAAARRLPERHRFRLATSGAALAAGDCRRHREARRRLAVLRSLMAGSAGRVPHRGPVARRVEPAVRSGRLVIAAMSAGGRGCGVAAVDRRPAEARLPGLPAAACSAPPQWLAVLRLGASRCLLPAAESAIAAVEELPMEPPGAMPAWPLLWLAWPLLAADWSRRLCWAIARYLLEAPGWGPPVPPVSKIPPAREPPGRARVGSRDLQPHWWRAAAGSARRGLVPRRRPGLGAHAPTCHAWPEC
jgi:hypothetical protein